MNKEENNLYNSTPYCDIFENINVQNWFLMLALKEPLAFSAMVGDNSQKFKNIFNNFKYTETKNSISWKIQDQSMMFNIVVDNLNTDNPETKYMVQYIGEESRFPTDIKISSNLIDFLEKILKNMAKSAQ